MLLNLIRTVKILVISNIIKVYYIGIHLKINIITFIISEFNMFHFFNFIYLTYLCIRIS